MADIAILVAEEYERRSRSSVKANEGEDIDLVSCVSVLAQRLNGFSWAEKAEARFNLARGVLEPKTEFGLAAINGFFSA